VFCNKESVLELFLYIGVEIPAEMDDLPENIFHIPAGEYLCLKREKSSIMDAANIFPEQFSLDYERIVIESELPLMDYDCVTPPFEIRCCCKTTLLLGPRQESNFWCHRCRGG